jgi:hypothetical protein
MNEPSLPPQWTSDYFREAAPAGVSPLGRGLVGHVPIVALLLIVQGILELAFGAVCLLFSVAVLLIPDRELANMRGLGIIMAIPAIAALVCGILRIVAGLYNRRFRRRILGMTALGVGLLSLLTGYCALTAIGLAVYGLIVYLNESVIAAFDMGDRGRPRSDIYAAFPPPR